MTAFFHVVPAAERGPVFDERRVELQIALFDEHHRDRGAKRLRRGEEKLLRIVTHVSRRLNREPSPTDR